MAGTPARRSGAPTSPWARSAIRRASSALSAVTGWGSAAAAGTAADATAGRGRSGFGHLYGRAWARRGVPRERDRSASGSRLAASRRAEVRAAAGDWCPSPACGRLCRASSVVARDEIPGAAQLAREVALGGVVGVGAHLGRVLARLGQTLDGGDVERQRHAARLDAA